MADPAVLDPSPYGHFPQFAPPNPSFSGDFDPRQFHDGPPFDIPLSPVLLSDFDFDVDFSIDDLLNLPDMDEDLIAHDRGGGVPSSPGNLGSQDGSGASSSSQASGDPRPGHLNVRSPDSGDSTTTSPESESSAASAAGGDVKSEGEEEERKGAALKRKKETEGGGMNPCANLNPEARGSKLRRSEDAKLSCEIDSGSKEDERRKARLMRNRESAQLSRQRKKHYVEELEDRIKAMNSTIADLSNKVSFFMAENASLRQQLVGRGGGGGGGSAAPAVYPPPPQMAPFHVPWIPCSSYALRPHGSLVPLIPIPRLKSQQPAPTPKVKKSEGKKSDGKKSAGKEKKVASICLLGLLFFVLLLGSIGRYRESRESFSGGYGLAKGGVIGQLKGGILTVSQKFRRYGQGNEIGKCSGKPSSGSPGPDRTSAVNSSEPLLASLYVPRNDKLVKIDGNLIINSVLASEKAMAQLASEEKGDKAKRPVGKEGEATGLAVMSKALALSRHKKNLESHPNMYGKSGIHEKALPYGSEDNGSRQQWFHEGLEGPTLSSGLCTEVFQFDAMPANLNSGGILPATSVANVTARNSSRPSRHRHTNRRILHTHPIPLPGVTVDNLEGRFGDPSVNSSIDSNNKSVSQIVVSVLADPREVGEGMIAPDTISRFFVVVLLDGIKYVTYSCGLPLKGSATHLVTS